MDSTTQDQGYTYKVPLHWPLHLVLDSWFLACVLSVQGPLLSSSWMGTYRNLLFYALHTGHDNLYIKQIIYSRRNYFYEYFWFTHLLCNALIFPYHCYYIHISHLYVSSISVQYPPLRLWNFATKFFYCSNASKMKKNQLCKMSSCLESTSPTRTTSYKLSVGY